LCGGIGFLVRKHGLTIDNLMAAEVVTADGSIIRTDAHTHADLFWALRGGGGNFGVVTRFQYRLHEIGQVYGGVLALPAQPDVIAGFIAEAGRAPDALSAIANIMPCPPMPFVPAAYHGKLIVMALVMYAGSPEVGARALAPFRALGTPIADMVRPMRYPEIFFPEDKSFHPTAVARTMFMNSVDEQAAQTIIENLETSDALMRAVQLRVLGGAMARVPVDATAFAHRKSNIMANVAAFYQGAEEKTKREAWVKDLCQALYQGNAGAYIGFMGDEGDARVHDAYPRDIYARLSQIKKAYDPDNILRLNHNIKPAG
jgi:FAD/FMN-containing dehydrogenase